MTESETRYCCCSQPDTSYGKPPHPTHQGGKCKMPDCNCTIKYLIDIKREPTETSKSKPKPKPRTKVFGGVEVNE